MVKSIIYVRRVHIYYIIGIFYNFPKLIRNDKFNHLTIYIYIYMYTYIYISTTFSLRVCLWLRLSLNKLGLASKIINFLNGRYEDKV